MLEPLYKDEKRVTLEYRTERNVPLSSWFPGVHQSSDLTSISDRTASLQKNK